MQLAVYMEMDGNTRSKREPNGSRQWRSPLLMILRHHLGRVHLAIVAAVDLVGARIQTKEHTNTGVRRSSASVLLET